MSGGETALFWVVAPLMVLGGLGLLLAKKAVHAALCMALVMICLGMVYFAQQAAFLGGVQIFVYTGAVMMLFLFVLMLVGVDSSDSLVETIKGQRVAAILFGLGFAGLLVAGIGQATIDPVGLDAANAADGGNVQGIARLIFGRYVLAFEVTSALLITAALGAMVLAHREHLVPKKTQREVSAEKIASDTPGNLPGPGVYARHNAVGTPGLLPDGTPTDRTVPAPLRGVSARVGVDHEDTVRVKTLAAGEAVSPTADEEGEA